MKLFSRTFVWFSYLYLLPEDTSYVPTVKHLTHLNITCATTAESYKGKQQMHLHNYKTSDSFSQKAC